MDERELLARTLMAEAGGEGALGMLAAGAVIRNRAAAGGYGDGLSGVIMKPGQFSAWNSVTGYAGGKGGLNMDRIRPSKDAYQVADMILAGTYEDPTGGATHYYNPNAANPKWGMGAGGDWQRIGNHVFGRADAGRGAPRAGSVPRAATMPAGQSGASPAILAGLAEAIAAQQQSPAIALGQTMAAMTPPAPAIMPRQMMPLAPAKRGGGNAYQQFLASLG